MASIKTHKIDNAAHPPAKGTDPYPAAMFSETKWDDKNKEDFHWVGSDEPHRTRRKAILKDHPEIRQLFGAEPLTAIIVLVLTALQIWVFSWIGSASWSTFFFMAYAFGGTINHSLQLCNHEISHNLCFGPNWPKSNLIMGIVANFVTGVPSSVAFRFYHYDHHMYQGHAGVDTDIPSEWELSFVSGTILKAIWAFCQTFAYALRPVIVKPKPITKWQVGNAVAQIAFNVWAVKTFGWCALAYMLASSFLGMGLHPCAGHFIAEHYEFIKGYETYSYYGSCNLFNLMVGYHNEHHDFPKVPWSRLHKVKAMAPEYYDHLPHHTSYIKVIWNFITDPEVGPWSRVMRPGKQKKLN